MSSVIGVRVDVQELGPRSVARDHLDPEAADAQVGIDEERVVDRGEARHELEGLGERDLIFVPHGDPTVEAARPRADEARELVGRGAVAEHAREAVDEQARAVLDRVMDADARRELGAGRHDQDHAAVTVREHARREPDDHRGAEVDVLGGRPHGERAGQALRR
jgi:hypothetical protein